MPPPEEDPTGALVVFGITGDLARKMTFRALYRLEERHRLDCRVIGVAREEWTVQQLREHALESIEQGGQKVSKAAFQRFARRLSYVGGDILAADTYQRLAKELKGVRRPLFYLEIPPSLFAGVVECLAAQGLAADARVVVEKPFGHDLASARQLDQELGRLLDEDQILRIDHFLGKDPVMDLQFLRFGNDILEPVWNRDHIASLQITMAEDFGVEDRGQFYDEVGALRDVVQNHLLQVLALVAMEPPSGAEADDLRGKKFEVLRAVTSADPAQCVRGQYDGYRKVPGVAPRSKTETFVALRLGIDNWRWAGVPIFIRAGKAMTTKVTEVRLIFRHPPHLAFLGRAARSEANQIVVRVDPSPGLRVQLTSKGTGNRLSQPVHLDLIFAQELGQPPEPYERLLDDAMRGDHRLFSREDSVEETWRIVQPLIDDPPPLETYQRGSWGPEEAARLVRGHPAWETPWLGEPDGPGRKAARRKR